MKNIYVVRHCSATGQEPNAQLTGIGAQQAIKLCDFLLAKDIDYIISSPFERAYRSIAPLADKLGMEIVLDDRLTERVLSDQNHPQWRDMLRKTYDDLDLFYEGGESGSTAMSRATGVVIDVLNRGCKNAVIVSHGNLITLLLKHYDERIGFREWEALSNPDVYQLSFINDTPSIHRAWTE